tara:strand:+ start:1894 stop:2760 length:867 start_codon:yes stop_codon:yes gene_type:complete
MTSQEKKTNLIIGKKSFLGENLTNRLSKNEQEVISLSFRPNKLNLFLTDLKNILTNHKIESVFICGSLIEYDDTPSNMHDIILSNIGLPAMVCSSVKKFSIKSKVFMFGTYWQFNEDLEFNPSDIYSATKTSAEECIKHFALDGVKVASIRLYDVYGRGDKRNKIFKLLKDVVKNKKFLDLSKCDQLIHPIHIDDVIDAIIIIDKKINSSFKNKLLSFSLNPKKSLKVMELISLVEEITGFPIFKFINLGAIPRKRQEYFSTINLKGNLQDWQPKVELREGLKEFLEE